MTGNQKFALVVYATVLIVLLIIAWQFIADANGIR